MRAKYWLKAQLARLISRRDVSEVLQGNPWLHRRATLAAGRFYVHIVPFTLPRVGKSTLTFEQDAEGQWWAVREFDPAPWPLIDIHQLVMENLLRDMSCDEIMTFHKS